MLSEGTAIIILSATRFFAPTVTNKQQIAIRLARAGYTVYYVEPVEAVGKKKEADYPLKVEIPKSLNIIRGGWGLPFAMKISLSAIINGRLYARRILSAIKDIDKSSRFTIINYLPNNYTCLPVLKKKLNTVKTVYDYVDDYASFPGARQKRVYNDNQLTAGFSDIISISSRYLETSFGHKFKSKVIYNPNVADYELFARARQTQTPPYPLTVKRASFRVVYTGAVNFKLDFSLVEEVCKACPQYDFIFCGPVTSEADGQVNHLKQLNNVFFIAPLEQALLPGLLKNCHAAWIPFQKNDHLKAVFPLKFFEYLAAGIPVCSADLESIKAYADCCYTAQNSHDFAAQLKKIYSDTGGVSKEAAALRPLSLTGESRKKAERGITAASGQTWSKRIRLLCGLEI